MMRERCMCEWTAEGRGRVRGTYYDECDDTNGNVFERMTRVCACVPVPVFYVRQMMYSTVASILPLTCLNSCAPSPDLLPRLFTFYVSLQRPFLSVLLFYSFLALPSHAYNQLYPSADTVVILDATSLRLIRTLAFSQVFPGRDHASTRITSLTVDPALKLVCTPFPDICFPLIPLSLAAVLHPR